MSILERGIVEKFHQLDKDAHCRIHRAITRDIEGEPRSIDESFDFAA